MGSQMMYFCKLFVSIQYEKNTRFWKESSNPPRSWFLTKVAKKLHASIFPTRVQWENWKLFCCCCFLFKMGSFNMRIKLKFTVTVVNDQDALSLSNLHHKNYGYRAINSLLNSTWIKMVLGYQIYIVIVPKTYPRQYHQDFNRSYLRIFRFRKESSNPPIPSPSAILLDTLRLLSSV